MAPHLKARAPRLVYLLIATGVLITLRSPAYTLPAAQAGPCDPPNGNPIVCENQLAGDPASEWDISGSGDANIQGFATDISVDQGQTVFFKIKSTTAYQLDIYRMGYYAGMGARQVATIPASATTAPSQPACLTNSATGLIDCGNWAVTASWSVPATAVSGIYFAKATRTGGGSSHIFFIVRDDDGRADVLFQTADTTWQAYNRYGGNSLYVGAPAGRAYKVSYNRPFTTRATSPEDWVFNAEYPMVRWLEANGYNVSYFSGVDSDRLGSEILEHRVFMSVGHDEYWSGAQRTNVESARAAGVHLAFFSGNEVFWKTRWESSIAPDGTPFRTLVCYKETHANGKIDPLPNVWTGTWRDPRFTPPADAGRPENALTGTIFEVNGGTTGIRVPAAEGKLRFWRNTVVANLGAGAFHSLPNGTLGYEWDEDQDNGSRPPGVIRLSDTTVQGVEVLQDYGSTYAVGTANHALTLYRHSSGALVFGAGTIQWTWGLDDNHDGGTAPTSVPMQQATVNLLADMGVQPLTLAAGLFAATPSGDTAAPSSSITSPANGTSVAANTSVTITGTAADNGGGQVGGVEVSVDGGATWRRATGRANWTFTWQTGGGRTVNLFSRAVDDSGNLEQPVSGNAITVGSGTVSCPCSIWTPAQSPVVADDNDGQPVEIGTRFRADISGYITAIRFYKSVRNVGPHVGNLWTAGGTLLASVPFSGVSASGWQEATLATPVAVSANTSYVVSYHTNSGFYAGDDFYFATTGVFNGPLQALRDGQDGPNGVYKYGASGFPTATYNSESYWVDVVFVTSVAPDTTSPQVTTVIPSSGASGVPVSAAVTAAFSENVQASTVTGSTFQLRDPAGALVTATVSYAAGSQTATLQPGSVLANSTTYSATVRGGSTGVRDIAGNPLANDVGWSFTTAAPPPPPPNEGPGGPILVVAAASNPFTRFYAEILRNEGLNAFLVSDITAVTSSVLSAYDVVILGEMSLTTAQVTMFSDWVTSGGNLIAMRPDKKLASLLGLADAGATLPEAYLLTDTSAAPGAGIVNQTIQFHGTADRYTLAGATPVATLYSNGTTATSNPAVTVRSVGAAGGQAAAFTYDLARSVVYTRQGNPAWSGQERDGVSPIRADDLFFGGAAPDWVDLTKVAIPQADEQQRLLANLIHFMNIDRKPLPRFWYLPRGLKAAVVLTGDDHGNNGTAGRFDIYTANSPGGCSVSNWECVRATSYIYPNTPISPSQAAAFVANGFEIGVHVTTGCADYTPQSLAGNFSNDLAAFASSFPGLPAPKTNRTHCIAWSDYSSHPSVEGSHGIRFDTNYYYWPPGWVSNTPGLFTGSGMPMRFAASDGTLIDVYQATTQLTDESDQSYPLHIDTLLNRALGPEGYYGVFTANMHTDTAGHPGSEAIVASAQSRGVPLVSSKQMLDWLDGRNGSRFENLTWNGTTLSFTVSVGAGANGLQALIPSVSSAGPVSTITRNGNPVAYTTQTIKGVGYALFSAAAGTYEVHYAADTTPPVISAVSAAPGTTSATVTWTTNEPGTSVVNYGVSPSELTASASAAGMTTSHSVPLTGLTPGTQYYYRVTSADASGNSASAPASPAAFATATSSTSVSDSTVADFGSGTGAGFYVAAMGDGELTLAPSVGAEFPGSALPSGWSSGIWNSGGAAAVSGGLLTVDGARAHTDAMFAPGVALEFGAIFNGAAYQHAGLGISLEETPWAIFSTGSGGSLYARTHTGSTPTDTLLPGNWLNAPHRYRIEWNASSVTFLIDGAVVATHSVAISASMRPIVSDFDVAGGALTVDWLRLSPYATTGTFTSRVLDAGTTTNWASATWTAVTPANTSIAVSARFGNTPTPDAAWTDFLQLSASGTNPGQTSRFVQYRAVLSSPGGAVTPSFEEITFSVTPPPAMPSISIADVSVTEGNSGTTVAVVTVTLSAPSSNSVSVNYATADSTAVAGTDYAAASATATFAPGITSTTISIPVAGETQFEPNETFLVNLTAPVNATIADGQGVITIVNDDETLPSISIADLSVTEGDSGSSAAVVTLTLSAASSNSVSVNYATANGTAVAGTDYTASSAVVTFTPGTTSATISIPVTGETAFEPNETFLVNLTAPVNATIADSQGVVTILNDDTALPQITIGNRSVTEGHAGSVNALFTVTLSSASTSTVTVSYATGGGTAAAGSDYATTSGTLTFTPGSTSRTITVGVLGDTLDESNETFFVTLSAPANATLGTPSQGTGTITDDDPLPSLRINDVTVTEGSGGTVLATFTVTLSAASGRAVSVNFTTVNGTATTAAGDYVARSGTLSFPAGTTSSEVSVTVNGDLLNENNETVRLNLSSVVNATIADASGTATILDDDLPPTLSINDVSVTEGNSGTKNVTFTLALSVASGKSITVDYATGDGTALAGGDYVAKTGTLTFAAGVSTRTFTVAIVGDRVRETVESFVVNLSNVTNATIGDAQGVCTITDND